MTDYEKICDFQNLYHAHKEARCGKRHKKDVVEFENNLSQNLWTIKTSLENESYKIAGYNKFLIFEPKEREIQALSYYDRIVQHVLCKHVLRPTMDKKLIYDNSACRIGKGTHFAINRLSKFFHLYYKTYSSSGYILKCDIHKYFPSINHTILKQKISGIFDDKKILSLLFYIIDSFENTPDFGLPMGNQSSQLFALYYLDEIDRIIKEKFKFKFYTRYMDDMIILHPDKLYLKECLNYISYVLENKLKLKLNDKTQIFPIQNGVDFLGFHFYLASNGKIIRKLRNTTKTRFKKRLKALSYLYSNNKISLEKINQSLASYKGHLCHGHTYKLRKHLLEDFILLKRSGQ